MSIETAGNAVLPFYILCDESGSMDANGGINAINSGLPELHAAIAGDPLVSDKCRIGLLTFSDMAEELLPLSNLSDVQAMPGCQAKGMTNYGEAFNLLRVVIQRDVANLKGQGLQVYRPAVFFMTDGEPTDDWEANHRALTDKAMNPQAPHIIAFGVAGANPGVIGKIGTKAAFIANQGTDPGNALKEILKSLTNTILNSSASSTPTLQVPTAPPGTTAVPLDVL
jgi:uncharacterized protein YegL